MYKVFNSTFEISLRVLILLNEVRIAQSLENIYVADFISTYGRIFGITDNNINGENQFMYSEFASRRELVRGALKELVLSGYVLPLKSNTGFSYRISDSGISICELLDSEYAYEYRKAVKSAIKYLGDMTLNTIIEEIYYMSVKSVQREK